MRRCANCGTAFPRDSALVTVLEAEAYRGEAPPPQLFAFHRQLAEIELRRGAGAFRVVNPYSDADELHRLLDGAQAARIVAGERPRTAIHVYPMSVLEPDPVLAVDPGIGRPGWVSS